MIETQRLILLPLTARQLSLWIEDISVLEKELGCSYAAEPMEGIFLDIVKGQYEIAKEDSANYLYHTFWFIILKSEKVVIGSADFKNVPDERGEIEIGYGMGKEFEHKGYMTEAVKAMCEWGLKQSKVTHIVAETERDNSASHRILEKCGFKLYRNEETFWWKL